MSDEKKIDELPHEVYDREFAKSYAKIYKITTDVAHRVAQQIYEIYLKRSYNAQLDTDAGKARAIAEVIAKEAAEEEAIKAYE